MGLQVDRLATWYNLGALAEEPKQRVALRIREQPFAVTNGGGYRRTARLTTAGGT